MSFRKNKKYALHLKTYDDAITMVRGKKETVVTKGILVAVYNYLKNRLTSTGADKITITVDVDNQDYELCFQKKSDNNDV